MARQSRLDSDSRLVTDLVIDINGNIPTKEILRAMLIEYAYPGYRKILGPGQAAVFGISRDEFSKAASSMSGSELTEFLLKKADSFAMPLGRIVEMFDNAGISRTCVLTEDEERTTGLKPVISNEYVGEIVKEYPDKFIGFAGADPLKGKAGVIELERAVTKLGLRGLCLVPFRSRIYADDKRYYPLYAKCEELRIPVWIHSSNNWSFEHVMDYGNPRRLDRVAVDFPDLKIIAGHGGWPWIQEMVVVAWRHPNVYIDTSAHRPAYFTRKGSGWEPLLHFGNTTVKQKIVFGSEWMVLGIPIAQVVEEIRQLPLKEDVKEMWLHENARRVLSL